MFDTFDPTISLYICSMYVHMLPSRLGILSFGTTVLVNWLLAALKRFFLSRLSAKKGGTKFEICLK